MEVISMVIEPLGSNMTIQAQTAVKPVETKPVVENTEVSTPIQETYVAPVTASVTKAENESGQNAGANAGEQQATNEKIKKAVEQLNKNMPNTEAVFGIHDDTNRGTIKIVDKETKDVIKEFPAEETLEMIEKAWELAGIMVDEKL